MRAAEKLISQKEKILCGYPIKLPNSPEVIEMTVSMGACQPCESLILHIAEDFEPRAQARGPASEAALTPVFSLTKRKKVCCRDP